MNFNFEFLNTSFAHTHRVHCTTVRPNRILDILIDIYTHPIPGKLCN